MILQIVLKFDEYNNHLIIDEVRKIILNYKTKNNNKQEVSEDLTIPPI